MYSNILSQRAPKVQIHAGMSKFKVDDESENSATTTLTSRVSFTESFILFAAAAASWHPKYGLLLKVLIHRYCPVSQRNIVSQTIKCKQRYTDFFNDDRLLQADGRGSSALWRDRPDSSDGCKVCLSPQLRCSHYYYEFFIKSKAQRPAKPSRFR
ncbi:hypothetical protein M422DRAFT_43372 [Sphaerobolus stellatus SS14]|nr:hypothetical protein M422DRAFT_43372 [Sphaerobolus stellatus SS14]